MPQARLSEIRVDKTLEKRLPAVSEREFQGLVEDIEKRGILVDLLVTNDGLLLDGHRRFAAAKALELKQVPVKRIALNANGGWKRTVAVTVNLFRRHLNEAQRASLGSTLLRMERVKARDRQRDGQNRGRFNRGQVVVGGRRPQPKDRATERAARAVGLSRQTFERVEAIKKKSPNLMARLLHGNISVSQAYKKVRVAEIKRKATREARGKLPAGRIRELKDGFGKYRCLYLDPPWEYQDTRSRGAAARHYPTLSLTELKRLPVGKLCHKEGAHVWMWATWPMIREGAPHAVLKAWGLHWAGEIIWDKEALGVGHWVRGRTEVLILGLSKRPPLLSDRVDQVLRLKRGRHSAKPEEFAALIEKLSPGPRIELFARRSRPTWDRWGFEA